MGDDLSSAAEQMLRQTLAGLIGYTCETSAPNSRPTTEFITDRWMQPVLDRLVEYVVAQCDMAETEGAIAATERLRREPTAEQWEAYAAAPMPVTRYAPIPEHTVRPGETCEHLTADPDRGCYRCCDTCNYDRHVCGGCGQGLRHDGREYGGSVHEDCCA